MAVLLGSYGVLRVLAASGYPHDYIEVIERIHFYSYVSLTVVLGLDMLFKVVATKVGGGKK
ncbi:MAG: hypothetical protein ABSB35_25540 [Bryobacteraceae bacterium]|jgi:hypothetical protein